MALIGGATPAGQPGRDTPLHARQIGAHQRTGADARSCVTHRCAGQPHQHAHHGEVVLDQPRAACVPEPSMPGARNGPTGVVWATGTALNRPARAGHGEGCSPQSRDIDEVRHAVAEERVAQGLTPRMTDVLTLARLAVRVREAQATAAGAIAPMPTTLPRENPATAYRPTTTRDSRGTGERPKNA
jgi:hypothetical protein